MEEVCDHYHMNANPTCVGMNRSRRRRLTTTISKPHMRGDEPVTVGGKSLPEVANPTCVGMSRTAGHIGR